MFEVSIIMVNVVEAFVQGLERPIILWLLSQKPIHGYGLIKELMRLTGRKLKPSMIYPFLHSLEKKGFAVGKWVEVNGRNVRYYSLTQKGRSILSSVQDFFKKPLKEVITDFLLEKRGK
jgi:PadR family transcriptional regulator PadR